ncbi:MAG: type II toxin-antitoxin system VapC family toxin [Candidatus Obscuribacterales bacterium]|nr:type II toxin-antitoxin system VapC family toxin [Candidatus Obscuribacterales bacterium]
MTGFLLDTNCISELVRAEPEPLVMRWIEDVDERLLFLSVLTIGEIRKGIAGLVAGKQRTKLESWLELEVKDRFSNRILAIDTDVAERWALLSAKSKAQGKLLAVIDGLIAATAQHYQLAIVTRNVSDFAQTDVEIICPWPT